MMAAGCSNQAPATTDAEIVLRVGQGLPVLAQDLGIRNLVGSLTGERLVGQSNEGRAEPRLVEAWETSADFLMWTFRLREGLQLHDGSPVDATQVSDILQGALEEPRAPGFRDVESIEATNARTITVRLNRPSALLLDDLAGYSLNVVKDGQQVGTGPFVLESSDDKHITLRAFEHYYAGLPGVDRIELTAYPSVRSAWSAMMRGEIDALYEVGREAMEFVEAESTVNVYSFPRSFVLLLGFNQSNPALRNPAVRRALNLAIDRERLVRDGLRGHGLVADGFMWPYHWAYDRAMPSYGFDPDESRRLLDQAGFPVKDTPAGPARFRLSCLLPEDVAQFEGFALFVQKSLQDVGVALDLEPVPSRALMTRMGAGDFDTFLFEMANARSLSWPYRFLHSAPEGASVLLDWGYRGADEALDRLRHATSDEETRAGVSALQRALYDDPPAVFISWDERSRAVSRRFQVPTRPGYDVFTSALLWQWKAAPATADPD